jgi:hypothetical protein
MPLGYLAALITTMPKWITMMIAQNGIELNAPADSKYENPIFNSRCPSAANTEEHHRRATVYSVEIQVDSKVVSEAERYVSRGRTL